MRGGVIPVIPVVRGRLRREVLNAEWFTSIRQAQIVIKTWLKQYNHIRPH